MSYHWLRADSEAVIQFDGERTPLREGRSARRYRQASRESRCTRRSRDYVLVWDVVHETRAWLSTEGVAPARTMVNVAGAKSGTVVTRMSRLPIAPIRPARPELWGIALRMSAERPWLGFGPDNFRHAYGRYAGFDRWDPRVHANNMYLETLTGAGIIGLVALLWLVAASGSTLWRARVEPTKPALLGRPPSWPRG